MQFAEGEKAFFGLRGRWPLYWWPCEVRQELQHNDANGNVVVSYIVRFTAEVDKIGNRIRLKEARVPPELLRTLKEYDALMTGAAREAEAEAAAAR